MSSALFDHAIVPTTIAPGIYFDMPNDAYHASDALSNTGLRNLARSPFRYWNLHRNPARPAPKAKQGQLEGSLAHCQILEPLQFANRYKIGPDVSANTKEWKAFVESNSTHTVIKNSQAETARAQAAAVRSIPEVAELLSRGRPEVSVFWEELVVIDEETGETLVVLCRIRPDWVFPVNDESVILVDVKTCGNSSKFEFGRQIQRKCYHGQEAWYRRGYEKATGKKVLGFVFVAVEAEWPHEPSALALDEADVALGERINARLLHVFAKCSTANLWPKESEVVTPVALPRY